MYALDANTTQHGRNAARADHLQEISAAERCDGQATTTERREAETRNDYEPYKLATKPL